MFRAKSIIKILVSLIVLYLIYRNIDVEKSIQEVKRMGLMTSLLSIMVLALSIPVISLRLSSILHVFSHNISARDLILPTYTGLFLNQFLPTSVGGDIYRVWMMTKEGINYLRATSFILVDRIFGILSAVVILGFSILFSSFVGQSVPYVATYLFFVVSIALIVFVLLGFMPLVSWPLFEKIICPIRQLSKDFSKILVDPKYIGIVSVYSVASQLIPVLVYYIIVSSLKLDLSFFSCMVIGPSAMIASAIPLAFAGWGIREAAVIFIMQAYNISNDNSFAVSILFGLLLMITSIPGGVPLLIIKRP